MSMVPDVHPLLLLPGDEMKQRAVRGALVTSAAQLVKLFVQIGSVILLTRMLVPGDFGIYAMAAPIIGLATLFQDFGLTQAIITSKDLSQSQAAMMFRINTILSVVVAVLLAASSPLISQFYKQPAITGIIIAMSFQIILSGLTASHKALLSRGLRFKQLAIIEIVSTLSGFIAAVLVAFFYPSPWALVTQTLFMTFVVMIGSWIATRWSPTESGSYSSIKHLMKSGFGMTSFNLTNYISRNADTFLIGWAHGAVELGLYDRAYKLLLFPLMQVNAPISNVMIPILSRISGESERYRHAYLRTVRQMLLLTTPGVAFLIASAPVLIPTLLGENWAGAVNIFMWLGVAGAHQTISNTFGWLFVSQRRVGEYAKYGLFSTVTCLIAFVVGLQWGAVGVAASYAISGIIFRLPVMIWLVGTQGPIRSKDIIITFVPYLISCLIAVSCWFICSPILSTNNYFYLVEVLIIIYTVTWSCLLLTAKGRTTFRESWNLLPIDKFRKFIKK